MNQTLHNVESLLDKLGDLSDMKLLLVYWQQIDQVKMNKETISTKDLLNKATSPESILDAKRLIGIMKSEKLLDE